MLNTGNSTRIMLTKAPVKDLIGKRVQWEITLERKKIYFFLFLNQCLKDSC